VNLLQDLLQNPLAVRHLNLLVSPLLSRPRKVQAFRRLSLLVRVHQHLLQPLSLRQNLPQRVRACLHQNHLRNPQAKFLASLHQSHLRNLLAEARQNLHQKALVDHRVLHHQNRHRFLRRSHLRRVQVYRRQLVNHHRRHHQHRLHCLLVPVHRFRQVLLRQPQSAGGTMILLEVTETLLTVTDGR